MSAAERSELRHGFAGLLRSISLQPREVEAVEQLRGVLRGHCSAVLPGFAGDRFTGAWAHGSATRPLAVDWIVVLDRLRNGALERDPDGALRVLQAVLASVPGPGSHPVTLAPLALPRVVRGAVQWARPDLGLTLVAHPAFSAPEPEELRMIWQRGDRLVWRTSAPARYRAQTRAAQQRLGRWWAPLARLTRLWNRRARATSGLMLDLLACRISAIGGGAPGRDGPAERLRGWWSSLQQEAARIRAGEAALARWERPLYGLPRHRPGLERIERLLQEALDATRGDEPAAWERVLGVDLEAGLAG